MNKRNTRGSGGHPSQIVIPKNRDKENNLRYNFNIKFCGKY